MAFSIHLGGVVMSSQITNTQSSNMHPLAHILDKCALIFQSFYSLSQPHHVTASLPSPDDIYQSMGGRSERIQGQAKMAVRNSFSYICIRALYSFQYFTHCRAASTVIRLLPNTTFTPSIQPNLGLPRTRPPLTSAINTLLAIRYSSILSTCTNHLNTIGSALFANSLSTPALLRTSSLLTLPNRGTLTKFLKHNQLYKMKFYCFGKQP